MAAKKGTPSPVTSAGSPLGGSPNAAARAAADAAAQGGPLFRDLAEGTLVGARPIPPPPGVAKAAAASAPRPAPRRLLTVVKPAAGLTNIRLLPVTIIVALVMLSVRVTDIWKGYVALSIATPSEAQQPPPPGGRKRGQKTPASLAASSTATGDAASAPAAPANAAPAAAPARRDEPAESPAAVPGGGSAEGEPPTFTQNEIDVLQKLSERREALDGRERDLTLRENLIKAAESRIDKKIAEMKTLQANVESMLKQMDDQDDVKMKSLVKIYENMKPKDAAKIFEQLDMPVLLGVIQRMKEQKIAPIMESMDPQKAKTITDAMAQRRGAKTEGQGG